MLESLLLKTVDMFRRFKYRNRCIHCGKKNKRSAYFKQWGTCNQDCCMEMVGLSYEDFI